MDRNSLLKLPTNLVGVFAHEDDEVFGPGGLFAKNVKMGGKSHVISFGGCIGKRYTELQNACTKLGVTFETLKIIPNNYKKLKDNVKIVNLLRDKIISLKPRFVVTHSSTVDYHSDHKIVSHLTREAAIRATLPVNNHIVNGLLYTEGHFLHSYVHIFVDITNEYNLVVEAAKMHKSQMKKNNDYYLNALNGRTILRGVQAGCERAEAYVFEALQMVGSMNRRNLGI